VPTAFAISVDEGTHGCSADTDTWEPADAIPGISLRNTRMVPCP
jgi:hypothetical protein